MRPDLLTPALAPALASALAPALALLVPLGVATAAAGCGVNETPAAAPGPAAPACVPDRDGRLTADELPVALGLTAAYYQAPAGVARTVDLVGAEVGGERRWDLSREYADDEVVALGPARLGAQWYAASFPAGEFVVDAGDGLDAVYHQDAQALWLDGTASRSDAAAGRTLVRYPAPVAVLRFPVEDGDRYATTAALPVDAAVIGGLPFVGADLFEVEVAGAGRVDLPYVRFSPALRVRTHLVRKASSGGVSVGRRTTALLFECLGEVAHAESKQDEPSADFTTALRLRRFALGQAP